MTIFRIEVEVAKEPTNEVVGEAWVPSLSEVVEEIRIAVVGKDLDTGWTFTRVATAVRHPLISLAEAEARGHAMEDDPPHGLSRVRRWTCTKCGRAVLSYAGGPYGSALEEDCDG